MCSDGGGRNLQDSRGRSLDQGVLEALVSKRCPKLIGALHLKEASLSDLTGSWFPTLFTTALPAETAVRVWDCLFTEGSKILYRIALALLKVTSVEVFTFVCLP
jgi:Rab-GTPase-TBC domain